MYKVIHKYSPDKGNTSALVIESGETLYVVEKTNESWWLASNSSGNVGYVPKNYIKRDENEKAEIVLQSIKRAIEDVYSSISGSGLTEDQQKLLKKLNSHKEAVLHKTRSNSGKRKAPLPPTAAESAQIQKEVSHTKCVNIKPNVAPPPPPRKSEVPSLKLLEPMPQYKNDIPNDLADNIISTIKNDYALTIHQSSDVLHSVLSAIGNEVPSLHDSMIAIAQQINSHPATEEEQVSDEGEELGLALANIEEIKDDAQQRNWSITNDESQITNILDEILSHITSLDKSISCRVLSKDDCRGIRTIVEYHQMELRINLRLLTLQILGAIASLSTAFVTATLATVLPLELARDIHDNIEDEQRVCYSGLVMSMLFSTAEQPPFAVYEQVNEDFVDFILSTMESDCSEQKMEMLVNFLLAFNLHFIDPSSNIVMKCIGKRTTCTAFSETLMVFINRGDDPVLIPEHWEEVESYRVQPAHSVLKFFQDIYSQESTSHFLYTNDMNVLLEIIVRNISDLPSGSKLRTDYLDLLLGIFSRTNYKESCHKAKEFRSCLERISNEEELSDDDEKQVLEFDKRIVATIFRNFGNVL